MAKINLAITVDNHVNTWLNEQTGKRSTIINRILNEYIINKNEKPKRKNVLQQRKLSFERHWHELQRELDLLEE